MMIIIIISLTIQLWTLATSLEQRHHCRAISLDSARPPPACPLGGQKQERNPHAQEYQQERREDCLELDGGRCKDAAVVLGDTEF